MYNSAMALNQLLAAINETKGKKMFIAALVEFYGLEGPSAEPDSVKYLYLLMHRIRCDIDELDIDDNDKARAHSLIMPFNGLANFSQLNTSIENANINFLNPKHLVGLTNLQNILSGHVNHNALPSEAKKLVEDLRSKRDEVMALELAEEVKDLIIHRLNQICAVIDGYQYFGPETLRRELEALIGAIALNFGPDTDGTQTNEKKRSWSQDIWKRVNKTLEFVNKADNASNTAISLPDKAGDFGDAMGFLIDKI